MLHTPSNTIHGLGDALALVIDLGDHYERAHGFVLVSDEGEVLCRSVCAEGHPIACPIGKALQAVDLDPSIATVVLISVDPDRSPTTLRALDVGTFQQARHRFEARGVELRDWLITDRADIRSMAISCLVEDGWSCQLQ